MSQRFKSRLEHDVENAIQMLRDAEILLRSPSATEDMKKGFLADLRGFLEDIDGDKH